ncbi:hypothetical protein BU23DRAFT_512655 [Bimuria novae-zelandiae CBS 107.79]|uniref:Exonuclease domain-containing protein n=1 Tax=Bimuria novae-zelandiae CBS 107.79 TaxID=1447943 RepID=A0A6A5UZ94_9PLEO|nr:hypothetical protein BU23DRAFT_512655 [Bimuria novae-zelandiae CBS 107.79]
MEAIVQSEDYLTQLRVLMEPKENLKQHGFITQPLTEEELLLKRRCLGCKKAMSQLRGRERKDPGIAVSAHAANNGTGSLPATEAAALVLATPVAAATEVAENQSIDPAKPAPVPRFKCKFHPGEVVDKYWTCCDQHCTADPCSGAHFHDPQDESLVKLVQHHQLYHTPIVHGRVGRQDIRAAVALDCEMGTAKTGDSELIKLTLIDYFTGEILIDKIVEPDVPLQHLNTKWSGVTWGQVRAAQRKRTSLQAPAGARRALWKFVGPETIVVGHGVHNDFKSLKWIHEHVVDSFIIEFKIKKRIDEQEKKAQEEAIAKAKADGTCVEPVKEDAVPTEAANGGAAPAQKKRKRKGGNLSLRGLAERRLNRKIQLGEGKTGHDSVEDTFATRDLVHWHITHPGAE